MSNDCSDLMLFSIFLGLKPRSHCVPRRTWTYVDVHCTLTYGDVVIEQVDFYTVAFTHTASSYVNMPTRFVRHVALHCRSSQVCPVTTTYVRVCASTYGAVYAV